MEYTATELDIGMKELLLRYGFSFDIALKEDGSVHLVEINPFGAMSGCGGCLFNWVLDGKMLYGLEDAEFAVTLEVDSWKAQRKESHHCPPPNVVRGV